MILSRLIHKRTFQKVPLAARVPELVVFAGQTVGIRELSDGIGVVSVMELDLGFGFSVAADTAFCPIFPGLTGTSVG
jgi:hypothetical protein